MKNEGFDVMGHMEETGQVSKPEVMKSPESTEGDILELIDSTIDEVLKKSRIQLNTGDTRIVPKLCEDLKQLVRDSVDRADFNERISTYISKVNFDISDTYNRHISRVITELFGMDMAGGLVYKLMKGKKIVLK